MYEKSTKNITYAKEFLLNLFIRHTKNIQLHILMDLFERRGRLDLVFRTLKKKHTY